MIINTGQRTDIPAFYSRWFMNRVRAGEVLVRNPFYFSQVTRYFFDPATVDLIAFCTKNPAPMLGHIRELSDFELLWYVTITPYGQDIEPHVPDKESVMESALALSRLLPPGQVIWRYDPILFTDRYTMSFHAEAFEAMCRKLSGKIGTAVISFLDLYEKTRRNFPAARKALPAERKYIGETFAAIAHRYGIRLFACCEGDDLARYGIDCSGCMTQTFLEQILGEELAIPAAARKESRPGCRCLIGNDIGAYDSCGHGCLYCYANQSPGLVRKRMRDHDPDSPFLIGRAEPGDVIHNAAQVRFRTGQQILRLF